ncbi:hypothetical protein LTR84_009266 [Exophiala bonariae]|uniref:Eisosome protein 1 n=1 Tax=Exophiala bonariae TaxID=1690606 RepID=A0AAV9MXV7_9EURO|nr:hypothetical protein LTR84_009266 [Exophiala bonariae]
MSTTTATPTQPSSYHNHPDKLEQQAASTAIHTSRETSSKPSSSSVLDEDGRLSSASAALSLKYARAQDLPSFPSTGGVQLASAGAAASLADSNKRTFEHWKPGSIPAANHAANIAKDYEMDPIWKPELSRAGSQAAAAAHKEATPVEIWKASESEHGHSAASSALQNQKSPPAITERTVSSDAREKALLAARKSLSSGRRRADSAPIRPQPQSPNPHAGWAQKAAMSSHRGGAPGSPSTPGTAAFDAARIQNMAKNNISRQMYTSNPPVAIEVEEKKRQDTLRASAIAMARKMYAIQQEQIDSAKGIHRSESHYAAHTARQRALSDAAAQPATVKEPPRYENLEDAARKLAHERLARIHDEHAEYRQYYGAQPPPKQSRLSLRRPARPPVSPRRNSSSDSDEEQSRKIRAQMSVFQSKLAEVDDKKRQADRDALLAAAHKNVTARLNAMDEKVFSETGKTSPHQRELWERQARERAQRESDDRLINVGKVNIGGGKYLDQSEIDAIARARLQPTLDEISEKAEQQRARDEEIRLEQERIKAEAAAEKKRLADVKAEQKAVADREKAETKAKLAEEKRLRQEKEHEDRRVRNEQKATEKKARDEAAAAEKERKRGEKEENKQSTPSKPRLFPSFISKGATAGVAGGTAAAAVVETTGDGIGAAAKTATSPLHGTDVRAAPGTEDVAVTGDTVHDQVTLDPAEAAYAVAAASDDEDSDDGKTKPAQQESTTRRLSEDDVDPRDVTGTTLTTAPATDTTQAFEPISPTSPTSPSKRDSRMKSWFKKKLKSGSKAENDIGEKPVFSSETTPAKPAEPLKEEENRLSSDSARDVALAGKSDNETDDLYGAGDKSRERVSPVNIHAATTNEPKSSEQRSRSISPVSSTLSEDPFVIAADVASSRYSAENSNSKRNSGADHLATVEDSDDEPRGRKGFRERFLKKVIPGRDKDKQKPAVTEAAPTSAAVAPISEQTETKPAKSSDVEQQTTVATESPSSHNTEPFQEKTQEPSTTSIEPATTVTTRATTPSLSDTVTNGGDDDFEEARDTFDEGALESNRPKIIDVSKAQQLKPELVDVTSPTGVTKKSSASPVGSRHSGTGGGSRFTEEL